VGGGQKCEEREVRALSWLSRLRITSTHRTINHHRDHDISTASTNIKNVNQKDLSVANCEPPILIVIII
jgi:hypothetical protein